MIRLAWKLMIGSLGLVVLYACGSGETTSSTNGSNAGTNPALSSPMGFTAKPGPLKVKLSWNPVYDATRYVVYSSSSSSDVTLLSNMLSSITATSFVHSGLTGTASRYYAVTAGNAAGESNASGPISAAPYEAIAAVAGPSMALTKDGTVFTWGSVRPDIPAVCSATPVSNLTDVAAIEMTADDYFIALKKDGTVWQWGNFCSIPGTGGAGCTYYGQPYQHGSNMIKIAGGKGIASLAIQSDGTVWMWNNTASPAKVAGLSNIVAIAAGSYHFLAVKSDGTVWAWGDGTSFSNQYGQLGDGSTTPRSSVAQVGGLSGIVAVAAGGYHSLAVKSNGTVWGWGHGFYGQNGNAGKSNWLTAKQVTGLANIKKISAGWFHSLALDQDGRIYTWGDKSKGQTYGCSQLICSSASSQSVVDISAGLYANLIAYADGIDAFGSNTSCALASGVPPTATNATYSGPVDGL